MLDAVSLEVISRFKEALLPRPEQEEDQMMRHRTNRGHKLAPPLASLDALTAKVVEYDGIKHLVFTNESIERSNMRNRRRWRHAEGTQTGNGPEDDEVVDSLLENDEDDEDDDEDEHPLKKMKLSDILAPLNHPLEIVSHPAILKTYKLQVFNRLATELIELIEVEQNSLNWLNKLLHVLNGEDCFYLLEENLGLQKYDHGLNDDIKTKDRKAATVAAAAAAAAASRDDADSNECPPEMPRDTNSDAPDDMPSLPAKPEPSSSRERDKRLEIDPFFALPEALKRYEAHNLPLETLSELVVLKDQLINYLQVSIQRQHEYIKNLTQLRNGIVRADRLKRDLYKWGKEMFDKKSS